MQLRLNSGEFSYVRWETYAAAAELWRVQLLVIGPLVRMGGIRRVPLVG